MSNAERETVIRWDSEDRNPEMYTADPAQARRWARRGYEVSVMDPARDGTPRSWSVKGAVGCVRFRRVNDGVLVKRANGAAVLAIASSVLLSFLDFLLLEKLRTTKANHNHSMLINSIFCGKSAASCFMAYCRSWQYG